MTSNKRNLLLVGALIAGSSASVACQRTPQEAHNDGVEAQREADKKMRKLERKLAGIQRIQKAKAILMDGQGLNEADAYESIRRQAMAKRLSMDDMAAAIIHANELLQYRPKDD